MPFSGVVPHVIAQDPQQVPRPRKAALPLEEALKAAAAAAAARKAVREAPIEQPMAAAPPDGAAARQHGPTDTGPASYDEPTVLSKGGATRQDHAVAADTKQADEPWQGNDGTPEGTAEELAAAEVLIAAAHEVSGETRCCGQCTSAVPTAADEKGRLQHLNIVTDESCCGH